MSVEMNRQVVLSQLANQGDVLRGLGVLSLALFGSNEATSTSDLDFLVEFEGSTTFDRYMDLKFFLEDFFNRPVDLVTKRSLKPQIVETVDVDLLMIFLPCWVLKINSLQEIYI